MSFFSSHNIRSKANDIGYRLITYQVKSRSGNKLRVKFVDFGNGEEIEASELYVLHSVVSVAMNAAD